MTNPRDSDSSFRMGRTACCWAKSGSNSQGLDDPAFPHVTYRKGASGKPTPVVRGAGIRVQALVVSSNQWAMSAAEIAEDYDLTEVQVRDALAFYTAHRTEIDADIADEEAIADACS